MARYACPKCRSIHGLIITVEMSARLIQNDSDEDYSTDIIGSDPWWEGEADVTCKSCGWSGLVKQLADPFKENQNGSSS